MNESGSSVLAVVDQIDSVPIVWWVDIGPRIAGMSRLCGAWVLDGDDREQTLRSLTAARAIVATTAGQSLLEVQQIAPARILDAEATLMAAIATRDELTGVATRRSLIEAAVQADMARRRGLRV